MVEEEHADDLVSLMEKAALSLNDPEQRWKALLTRRSSLLIHPSFYFAYKTERYPG